MRLPAHSTENNTLSYSVAWLLAKSGTNGAGKLILIQILDKPNNIITGGGGFGRDSHAHRR